MSWWKIGFLLIVVAAVWWLIYHEVDLGKVSAALYVFPKSTLLGVLLLSVLILVLKAARFWTLLHKFGIRMDFWQTVKVSIAGSAASPLPGGEAFRGVLLKQEINRKMSHTTGAIIGQAYFEMAVAVFLMSFGIFINLVLMPYVLGCIGLMIFLGLCLTNRATTAWIKHLLPDMEAIKEFFGFLSELQEDFQQIFINEKEQRPNQVFFEIVGLTLIAHVLGGALLWLIFSGLEMPVDFISSIFLYSSSIVLSGIGTFSPGGLGITEGGLFGLMAVLGINPSGAIAAVVVFRFSTLIFSIILGILFLIVFYGRPYLKKRRLLI